VTGGTGLRRFVRADPAPPAATSAPADGRAGPGQLQPGQPGPSGPSGPAAPSAETCELCAAGVPAEHGHVADLEQATLICACRACYLLFTHAQAGRGRYRAVPDRYLADPQRRLSAADWDQLGVPVGLAFFLRSSLRDEMAGFYPSPAGATECRLNLNTWHSLAESYPLLDAAAPDVEAILISRSDSGVDCFLVPIDACYELAGRMRLLWRGFDGGEEARASIAGFLDGVRSRSRAYRQDG
jgi:Family of unknown function (DUF5947)